MKFITDLGKEFENQWIEGKLIGRYGVWDYDESKGKHQVIDTGDNLEELKGKHGEGIEVMKIRDLKRYND